MEGSDMVFLFYWPSLSLISPDKPHMAHTEVRTSGSKLHLRLAKTALSLIRLWTLCKFSDFCPPSPSIVHSDWPGLTAQSLSRGAKLLSDSDPGPCVRLFAYSLSPCPRSLPENSVDNSFGCDELAQPLPAYLDLDLRQGDLNT